MPSEASPVSAGASRIEVLVDRFNPILVKETRQALRGKAFRAGYLIVLLSTCMVGLIVLANSSFQGSDDSLGKSYFMALYGPACVGLCAFLPIACFHSMSAEWEGSTHDLLALTELTPAKILRGKLATALVQGILFASASVPFLALVPLMPGISLVNAGFLLALLPIASGSLCCMSLAIAAHSKSLGNRGFVLGGVALISLVAAWLMVMLAGFTVERSSVDTEQFVAIGLVALFVGLAGAYLALTALGPLGHPEENVSTPVRVFLTGATLTALVVMIVTQALVFSPLYSPLAGICFALLLGSFVPFLGLVTERQGLGRRTALRVAEAKTSTLAAPWLPGPDRGLLLAFILGLPVALLPWAYALLADQDPIVEPGISIVMFVYLMAYLSIAPLILKSWCKTTVGRWRARALVVAILVFAVLLPQIADAFAGGHLPEAFFLGDPFHSAGNLGDPNKTATVLGVCAIALFLIPVVARSAARGYAEVSQARRATPKENR